MSHPRYDWWGYAKNMVRRYPDRVNENERAAVEAALAETERMENGPERLRVIRMVLIEGSHTLEGVTLQIPCSRSTAQRHHRDFIRCVGRHFKCDGLY